MSLGSNDANLARMNSSGRKLTANGFFACAIIACLIFIVLVMAPIAAKALGNVTHTAIKAHVSMSLQQKGY